LQRRRGGPRQWRRQRAVLGDRARRHSRGGPSPVLGEELLPILRRLMLRLHLRGHRRNPPFLQHASFRGKWPRLYASASAVEADAVVDPSGKHSVVYPHGVDVHIVNSVHVHAIDRRVVEKVVAVPVAAIVSMPGVAVPVIHAAIVPDV
jgi:hypothetical protein